MRTQSKAFTALIIGALIGGLGNTLLASNPQNPWLFTGLRFLIAAIPALYWTKQAIKLPWILKLTSLMEVASIITLVFSLSTISVAFATIIGAVTPILTLIINNQTHHQTTPKLILLPIGLGITATILIGTAHTGNTENQITGIILITLSTLLWTASSLINGWYGPHTSPWARTALTNLLGAILIGIPTLALTTAHTTPETSPITWQMIVIAAIVAILPGTIAKALNLYALQHIPVPAVMQASTISTITAVITAAWFLNQQPSLQTWIGVLFGILASITLGYVVMRTRDVAETEG